MRIQHLAYWTSRGVWDSIERSCSVCVVTHLTHHMLFISGAWYRHNLPQILQYVCVDEARHGGRGCTYPCDSEDVPNHLSAIVNVGTQSCLALNSMEGRCSIVEPAVWFYVLLFLGFSGAVFHYILLAADHEYGFACAMDIQAGPAPSESPCRSYPCIALRRGARELCRMSARPA